MKNPRNRGNGSISENEEVIVKVRIYEVIKIGIDIFIEKFFKKQKFNNCIFKNHKLR